MIPISEITEWRQKVGWVSNDLVEQDLILSRAIVELYNDPRIASSLAFRGGTALNKLFFKDSKRYSEDLDFIQIRPEPIGTSIDVIRSVLDPWLGTPKRERNEKLVKLRYRIESTEGRPLNLKLEINSREHFLAEAITSIPYGVKSRWFTGESQVTTLSLDWLMGSKLRALYQRKKGRDLFDLYLVIRDDLVSPERIVVAFSKHLQASGILIPRATFINNLSNKLSNHTFTSDIGPLLREEDDFDIEVAYQYLSDRLFSLLPE